nr:two pore calcium channel protein 1A-like [Nicotiana tomentosiformis]
MATLVCPHGLNFMSNGNWIRYLLIARMLRFIRLLMHIERFRAFVTTFLTLIHCLLPYLGTIFCILCIYCSLGLQFFGGIVNTGNPKLHQTDLVGYDYLLFNFNDYPNGMVTLFNLLVMGIWSPLMQSYKDEGTDRDFLDLCLLLQLLSYCRFVAIKFDCSICLWKLFKQK